MNFVSDHVVTSYLIHYLYIGTNGMLAKFTDACLRHSIREYDANIDTKMPQVDISTVPSYKLLSSLWK